VVNRDSNRLNCVGFAVILRSASSFPNNAGNSSKSMKIRSFLEGPSTSVIMTPPALRPVESRMSRTSTRMRPRPITPRISWPTVSMESPAGWNSSSAVTGEGAGCTTTGNGLLGGTPTWTTCAAAGVARPANAAAIAKRQTPRILPPGLNVRERLAGGLAKLRTSESACWLPGTARPRLPH
jgi:hypothetical protein